MENPDILADLARRRRDDGPDGQVIVGFAAETSLDLDAARAKLARKGCDLLVVNQVGNGQGFGARENEWFVLDAEGTVTGITAPVEGRPGRRRSHPGHRPAPLTLADRPRPPRRPPTPPTVNPRPLPLTFVTH